jgi:nucleoside-diphosphate-sugar epimerase
MRIILTGATGYIGSAVAARLRAGGHDVRGLARSDEAADALAAAGVTPVRGALGDADVLAAAARDADAVVHAGFDGTRQAVALDAGAVDAFLGALAGSGKALVYTSGTAVLGDTSAAVADEDAPAANPAMAWRAEIERRVREAEGVRGIVIRPALVYGRGDASVLRRMRDEARAEGTVSYPGDGANRWGTVHVDDLADLYALAVERAPAGALYHAAGPEALEMREIAALASRAAGAEGRTRALDREEAKRRLGFLAGMMAMDLRVSSARARDELGWTPQRPSLREEMARGSDAGG